MIPGWEWVGSGALVDPDGRLVAVAGLGRAFAVDAIRPPLTDLTLDVHRLVPPARIDLTAGPFVIGRGARLPERTGWRLVAAADGYLLDARAVRLADVEVNAAPGEPMTLKAVALLDVAGTWRVLDG